VLQAFGVSHKGRVRTTNEDCFAVDEARQLCVVADGMGGHRAGEIAAQMAVNTLIRSIADGNHAVLTDRAAPPGTGPELSGAGLALRRAVHLANTEILEVSQTDAQYAGMGTTLVATLIKDARLTVAHVGDSRVYVLTSAGLQRLTRDDSWVAAIAGDEPEPDLAVVRHHPLRNVLTNVVGTRSDPDVHVREEALAGGELLLLSTDGVHGVLEDQWLERVLTGTDDVREMAVSLVGSALARGSRDNCTVVVARYTK
jgi:protein phosphatase